MFNMNDFFTNLDKLYSAQKMAEAEQALLHGLDSAMAENDHGAALSIANETIGFYRVHSNYENCLKYANIAQSLIGKMNLSNTIHHGTTLLNIATAFRASGKPDEAMQMYLQTLAIYKRTLPSDDVRFGGIYNNIALLYNDMGDSEKAMQYVQAAYDLMQNLEDCASEKATTLTNLGMILLGTGASAEAKECLLQAISIFENDIAAQTAHHDPHYAGTIASIAQIYYSENDLHKAAEYYKKSLDIIKATYGENDAYKTTLRNYNYVIAEIENGEKA